jgi:ferritin-like metal-binding protein YciE
MSRESLSDLLLDELKDGYDAEHQIIAALPKMIKATSSSQLKKAFQSHLEQTQEHVARLEKAVFVRC